MNSRIKFKIIGPGILEINTKSLVESKKYKKLAQKIDRIFQLQSKIKQNRCADKYVK